MLGRYLEKLGGSQARKDIHHLMQLQPQTARRREESDWVETKVNRLRIGDKILIKPGERVPADAKVLENSASVNESLLTGESKPVEKQPGDMIYAGTIINDSALIAEVEKLGENTNLGQITNVVESTLNQKPPIQRMADKASKYFALGIVTAAVITFFGWWLIGATPSQALLNAVAVLVVACPCALGLATPLALAITLGKTAQKGILVRKPSALELAAQVTRIVFDKTGTLTKGNLGVVDVVVNPDEKISKDKLLCIAASVEQFSEHPIARAVVNSCQDSLFEASGFKSERGQGVIAKIQDEGEKEVKVGSKKFLGELDFSKMSDQAEERTTQGDTVVWVSWDEKVRGFLILRDELEKTAPEALKELKEDNIKSSILSGDDPRTVKAIAKELVIEDQQGNVSPKEKAAKIKEWQSEGEVVAMIGDGVNDAPGLAQADLSITTASGTDVAGETSDIVFTRSDLKTIPWMIKLSEKTRHIIRENLGWAFAYNLIAVPLAAFGIISPVIAAAAMASSSLLVVGNSLRLR
jgi:Cu+-exporting ATPase